MNIVVTKAWIGRSADRKVVHFRIGSTLFSYISTANTPMIWQHVGGDQVRQHRRELNSTDDRYIDIRRNLESMLDAGQVAFGPAPAI